MYHGDMNNDGEVPIFSDDDQCLAVMPSMPAAKAVVIKARLVEAAQGGNRHTEIDPDLVRSLGGRLV